MLKPCILYADQIPLQVSPYYDSKYPYRKWGTDISGWCVTNQYSHVYFIALLPVN